MDEEITEEEVAVEPEKQPLLDPPEPDPLAQKWGRRLAAASRKLEPFVKRCRHNRKIVEGFDTTKDPSSGAFVRYRANLIQGTITTLLPTIYAKNPEVEVRPAFGEQYKLFAQTLERVLNRELEDAKLKQKAKSAVRGALTTSIGCLKIAWQGDERTDRPETVAQLQDSRDNVEHINGLRARLDTETGDKRALTEELDQTLQAIEEGAEVAASYGVVIDRVLPENIIVDPTVINFEDYEDADWIAQVIPMKRAAAEEKFGYKLSKATVYRPKESEGAPRTSIASGKAIGQAATDDEQICIYEVWDKASQRVYTFAQGCSWWLKEPYSPRAVGERWYPFFLLPFQVVDGSFVGPSIVDLTEKLQEEHNAAREEFCKARAMYKPGWLASSDVKPRAGQAFVNSDVGDVTFLDIDSESLQRSIVPKTFPPLNAALYDTQIVRQDWELVTGLQDAQRSSVTKAKTATEAQIMQNAQAGRVVAFQDQVDDWLQDIAQYVGEICLQQMTPEMVARICAGAEFDWPQLSRDDVFYRVGISIRAGSSGKPDKLAEQETWQKILPTLMQMIQVITQSGMQGMDVGPLEYLLQQTVARFDDTLDLKRLVPNLQAMQQAMMAQQAAAQAAQAQKVPAPQAAEPEGKPVEQGPDGAPQVNPEALQQVIASAAAAARGEE